jgi:lysozyme
MILSENGLNFIKQFEGCRLTSYLDDCGVPTIGFGTIVYQNGDKVQLGQTITQEQADSELYYQVGLKAAEITPMVSANLNQNQQDSVISFCYNVGTGAFHGSTLRRLINANPQDPNITAAFEVWDKGHVNGQLVVIEGLLNRRKAEAALYFS